MSLQLTGAQRRFATLSALLGNALEWFDFAVYGYLATPLGKAFFPAEDGAMQAVAAFGVFAVGYLMRPVGSLVLGPIGDLFGRREMLSLSIVLMGASSLAIALLPTHAQVGMAAGLLLLLMRMLQGFSVGGEFTGSMTYATEAARPGQQGFLASLATAGGLVGFSLGSLTVALLAGFLGDGAMDAWGWRLPFGLGALVAVVGLWMRRRMPETLEKEPSEVEIKTPGALIGAMAGRLQQVASQWRLVLRIAALVSFANVVFYVLFVYLVDYTGHQGGANLAEANAIATLVQSLGLPFVLLGGVLVDRYGKRLINRIGNLMLLLVTPLVLPLVQLGGTRGLLLGQAIGVLPVMLTMGAQGVTAVEMVPVRQRCAVFSIAYSLAMALFAGTSPLVSSWLLEQQGWQWGPALYCCLYAIPALWALRQR
ncbi:MFS transporter [Cyanobium sp. WAJ14-Wanaka]|uniref:MFS transporter n=1 Tax=Cyanobium sp. WAJ14-Wanaka TaxID=2823725 RepID=UPI0020CCB608|nr:MFS transporter [Cyanobium sp. WAJ14-Wanaka]MCP9774966.1 MFS transporter [Cyanobium sp. WAJ14-Wanaka]